MSSAAENAAGDQQAYYDERYASGYRQVQDFSDLYEACRVVTVRETLDRLEVAPTRVPDYGCGEGRYLAVVRERFPSARLAGSDVSRVALDHAAECCPDAEWLPMEDERVPAGDHAFDLIVSIEVLEHASDVELATSELGRLLGPGRTLVLTTPCVNAGSLEWLQNWPTVGCR